MYKPSSSPLLLRLMEYSTWSYESMSSFRRQQIIVQTEGDVSDISSENVRNGKDWENTFIKCSSSHSRPNNAKSKISMIQLLTDDYARLSRIHLLVGAGRGR